MKPRRDLFSSRILGLCTVLSMPRAVAMSGNAEETGSRRTINRSWHRAKACFVHDSRRPPSRPIRNDLRFSFGQLMGDAKIKIRAYSFLYVYYPGYPRIHSLIICRIQLKFIAVSIFLNLRAGF